MSEQDLLIPGQQNLATVPDYAMAPEEGGNLLGDLGGAGYTRLTFKGNRFRVKSGEEEVVLDETKLKVIMLNAYPKVSRIFYAGGYDETAENRPLCASADGEHPLPSVEVSQAAKCNLCPQNQKGSAIGDDGGKRRACSFFKRVAFQLIDYPEFGPVVSDVKAMSLFGESHPDSGYLNLRAYADKLAKHRTKPEALITEISFDSNSSVPKLLFKAVSYVAEEYYRDVIEPILISGTTEVMVDCTQIRVGGDDDDAGVKAPEGGFRDRLLGEEEVPAHAAALAPPPRDLQAELEAAIAAKDFASATDIQALIAAEVPPPAAAAPPPAAAAPRRKTVAPPPAAAAPPPAAAAVPPMSAESPEHINAHGEVWNPDIHATSSATNGPIINADGHFRARRGIKAGPPPVAAPAAAAVAPPAVAPPVPLQARGVSAQAPAAPPPAAAAAAPPAAAPPATTEFDEELDAALAEWEEEPQAID